MSQDRRPWIIAHRGARDEAPENSFSALSQALHYPIEGVEFDVQMSSDAVPVLYHDRTLAKVGGGRRRVNELTLTELKKIDWGRWFEARFAGEPLTTLEKTLTLLKRCSNMCIEIKSSPKDSACGHYRRLTEKVLELVNAPPLRSLKNRILILSFDTDVLEHGFKLDPDLRYVFNIPENDPIETVTVPEHLWAVGVRISKLSPQLAQWARKCHLRLFTYTCNGPRQVKKAMQIGVNAIITDRPAWLARKFGRF